LILPIWALYLLLQDLVEFYFTAEHPGLEQAWFYPRFVLSGIGFLPDESRDAKSTVLACEADASFQHFVLPYEEQQLAFYDHLLEKTSGQIIPEGRRAAAGEKGHKDSRRFHAVFGMTGTLDRTLVEEVAKMETSLVRHAIGLRRLVLRYMKALLMFIWTFMLTIVVAGISRSSPTGIQSNKQLLCVVVIYCLWALTTPHVVHLPIRWIYRLEDQNKRKMSEQLTRDPALFRFERMTKWCCYISLLAVLIAAKWLLGLT
jgi:hypothetical protein